MNTLAFKSTLLAAALTCGASVAAAGTLRCLAQEQCRGDAEAMCAPSSLEIEVRKQNGYNRLWIDKQGPYSADYSLEGSDKRWRVEAFGGQHRLDLKADGQFVYLGNRGKRYSGQCEGQV
ncbi:hypothetical protein [Thalassovita mangrovi]|uniref:Membrane-bound lysozyme-inhibitor of c-type lysozyme n=1 Tax=Thalassovita mangrovi TaxID=2692236 RepID=A0A6L8LD49_9RHOB|nr:hypothetical protein [Thalassovita mangrovi]MYM53941.1 hypothetical protein [Thalassovita mangrovi]